MNDKRRKADNSLEHLTERLVDTILAATDSELLADAKEDGVDLAAQAAHGRHLLTQALAAGGKRKLAAARAALEARSKSRAYTSTNALSPIEARAVLERALREAPETANKLTLAARKGQSLSDADVYGMLDDLADLGLLPATGKEET